METTYTVLLSLIVFLPALAAMVLLLVPVFPKNNPNIARMFTFAITVVVFLLTVVLAWPTDSASGQMGFEVGAARMQGVFRIDWIPYFNIQYFMGVDGISLSLVVLTSFVSMLAMAASWPIDKHVKAYCVLFLLLETGMLGVFLALDFFLFYVFWEVMLLPMYFLIGVWGGPRREYAAIKFFLYTLLGSVLMLLAILMLYFNSDLRLLSDEQLVASHVIDNAGDVGQTEQQRQLNDIRSKANAVPTFNLLALAEIGQHPNSPFDRELWLGKSIQWWAFVLLFIGFAVKVPAVPVHTWLPDAHVEAPTPISMILAGVLLKMGGYGIIRICYPICPDAGFDLAWVVVGIGVVSMVYGAFAAMAQKDFKRLVAYSSVSHMGYVLVGIGVWSAVRATNYDPSYWQMGMNGAIFQMLAHGISSAGMFFMVGVIYDRVHHRDLDQFGGLFARMPVYSALAFGLFFAGLGLPGLCGFIGEVFVTLSVWKFSYVLAVISAATVILTAGYILWTLQRVYLGPEYKGPHPEAITPSTWRERGIGGALLAFAILFGVYPHAIFQYLTPSVNREVEELAHWTRTVKEPRLQLERAQANAPAEAPLVASDPR